MTKTSPLFFFIFVVFFSRNHIHGSTETRVPAHVNNVIILLDTQGLAQGLDTETRDFALAVCQQAAPIIVLSHTIKELFNKIEQFSKNPSFKKIAHSLSDDFWDFYKSVDSEFYLLLPKWYVKEKLSYNSAEFLRAVQGLPHTPEEILLGFKVDPKSNVMRKTWAINKQVKLIPGTNIDTTPLKNMFTQGKGAPYGMWNIYMSGHGFPTDVLKKDLVIKDITEVDTTGAIIAGLNLQQFRDLIAFFNEKIQVNFLYYLTCFGGGLNRLLPYLMTVIVDREILGYTLEEEKKPVIKVVTGLQEKETSEGVTYIPKYPLPHFTIAVGSTTDLVSNTIINYSDCLSKKVPWRSFYFDDFFRYLNQYTAHADRATRFTDQELKNILSSITTRQYADQPDLVFMSSLPQIMHPGQEMFRAIALDDQTLILNDTVVKAAELEQKTIVTDKTQILIYPLEISIPLELNKSKEKELIRGGMLRKTDQYPPIILAMTPGVSLQKYKKIVAHFSFTELIDALTKINFPFSKYIYIEKLTVINDKNALPEKPEGENIELNNVIIKFDESSIYVLFNDQESNVYFGYAKYTDWTRRKALKIEKLPFKFSQLFEDFPFINAIYNYFGMRNREILREQFNVELFKKLVSKKEQSAFGTSYAAKK